MWMSSLVLTIHNFGVPNFDPYPYGWKMLEETASNSRALQDVSLTKKLSKIAGCRIRSNMRFGTIAIVFFGVHYFQTNPFEWFSHFAYPPRKMCPWVALGFASHSVVEVMQGVRLDFEHLPCTIARYWYTLLHLLHLPLKLSYHSWWLIPLSYVSHYQRVHPIIIPKKSPLLTIKSPFSYGKP